MGVLRLIRMALLMGGGAFGGSILAGRLLVRHFHGISHMPPGYEWCMYAGFVLGIGCGLLVEWMLRLRR